MILTEANSKDLFPQWGAQFYHPARIAAFKRLGKGEPVGKYFELSTSKRSCARQDPVVLVELADVEDFGLFGLCQTQYGAVGGSTKAVAQDAVMISRLRPYLQQVVLAGYEAFRGQDIVCSPEFQVVQPIGEVPSQVLFAYLASPDVQTVLKWSTGGSSHPRFEGELLLTLPLPKLDGALEARIVELVDASLRERQLAWEAFEQAYAVFWDDLGYDDQAPDMPAVFELQSSELQGRMDSEFYRPLSLLATADAFSEGTITLEDVSSAVFTGVTPAKDDYFGQGAIRVLKFGDVTGHGLDWVGRKRAAVPVGFKALAGARVQDGDILIPSTAHTKSYIANKLDMVVDCDDYAPDGAMATAEIMVVRPDGLNPTVLLWWLRSRVALVLMQRLVTGSTAHLYPRDMKGLPIPRALMRLDRIEELEALTLAASCHFTTSKRLMQEALESLSGI